MALLQEKQGLFSGWIPETDVDGIDIKKDYFSVVKNIDYGNGYIQNAVAPTTYTLHANVLARITAGYSITSSKAFTHSTRGECIFFMLHKNAQEFEFWLWEVDTPSCEKLYIFDLTSGITFPDHPTETISYSYVNEELKININETATIFSKSVILNLSLQYLTARLYNDTIKRSAGWYLCPRWLGWNYTDITYTSATGNENYPAGETTFNTTPDTHIVYTEDAGQWFKDSYIPTGGGTYSALTTVTKDKVLKLEHSQEIQRVVIEYKVVNVPADYLQTVINFDFDGDVYQEVWTQDSLERSYGLTKTLTLEKGIHFNTVTTFVNIYSSTAFTEDVGLLTVKSVSIDYGNTAKQIVTIAKYFDGQRALVKEYGYSSFPASYKIKIEEIDWRVTEFEVYAKSSNETIAYLLNTNLINSNFVDGVTGYLICGISSVYSSVTLNFNYGLGATVRVDNQKKIYDEVVYRGRVYFVNNDFRVYQSHIAGNAKVQPDSFPYDEDSSFGYFEIAKDDINKALCVTPMDELCIITDKNNYVYSIEGGAGIPLKRLKSINGGQGIDSINTLTKSLGGLPSSQYVIWLSDNSILLYGGGINAPISISEEWNNYLLALENRSTAIAFYNKSSKEYWIQIDEIFYIFELENKRWRMYDFGYAIKEVIGVVNDEILFLKLDDTIVKVSGSNTVKLDAIIETHYNSNVAVNMQGQGVDSNDIVMKILQSFYLSFKDADTTEVDIENTIIVDDVELDPILMYNTYLSDNINVPLALKYGKIKFRLEIPANNSKIREIGYEYVPTVEGKKTVNVEIEEDNSLIVWLKFNDKQKDAFVLLNHNNAICEIPYNVDLPSQPSTFITSKSQIEMSSVMPFTPTYVTSSSYRVLYLNDSESGDYIKGALLYSGQKTETSNGVIVFTTIPSNYYSISNFSMLGSGVKEFIAMMPSESKLFYVRMAPGISEVCTVSFNLIAKILKFNRSIKNYGTNAINSIIKNSIDPLTEWSNGLKVCNRNGLIFSGYPHTAMKVQTGIDLLKTAFTIVLAWDDESIGAGAEGQYGIIYGGSEVLADNKSLRIIGYNWAGAGVYEYRVYFNNSYFSYGDYYNFSVKTQKRFVLTYDGAKTVKATFNTTGGIKTWKNTNVTFGLPMTHFTISSYVAKYSTYKKIKVYTKKLTDSEVLSEINEVL